MPSVTVFRLMETFLCSTSKLKKRTQKTGLLHGEDNRKRGDREKIVKMDAAIYGIKQGLTFFNHYRYHQYLDIDDNDND